MEVTHPAATRGFFLVGAGTFLRYEAQSKPFGCPDKSR